MTIPIIALDIDGVLADFGADFMRLAASLHPNALLSWNSNGGQMTWKYDPLTNAQTDATWRYVYDRPSWWGGLSVIPSNPEIRELTEFTGMAGGHVQYITARGTARSAKHVDDIRITTMMWLRSNGFPQPENVTLSSDKAAALDGLIDQFCNNGDEPALLGLLDDRSTTVQDLSELGYPVVIRDWPYNRGLVDDSVPRVYSLGEFMHLMRSRNLSVAS